MRRKEETPKQRLDRNLMELLGELRVALPGVQVLFAFLLAVPFAARFDTVSSFDKHVYFATLLSTAISTALLITPSAYHRILFRYRDRENIIFLSNKLIILGLAFMAIAITGAVLLITDFLFSRTAAIVTAGLIAALFIALWYVAPYVRRKQLDRAPDIEPTPD
jgi:hypothetical protein